jgi:ABC-type antimicrobial peptide transport system permease subunit
MTVVGVVGSVREDGLREPPRPIVYEAARQTPKSWGSILAKSFQDRNSLLSAIVHRIRERFPEVAVYVQQSKSLDRAVRDSVWELNYSMLLLTGLAGLAFLVSSVGVYGVISYSGQQRTREIGLRIALGAERSQVVGMILRQGLFIAVPGVVIGLIAAAGLTHILGSLLYGVEPLDWLTFALVAVVMMAAALLASYLPARQAAKLDPTAALRCD